MDNNMVATSQIILNASPKPGVIYTPENFDPKKYPGPITKFPDAARWLLNTIYYKRLLRNYSPEDFVNLHSTLLGMVMGKWNYVKPVREALEKHQLIECDHTWIRDVKSLGYRLGPALEGDKWVHYKSTNKRFLKRVQKFREYIRNPSGFTLPVHQHLANWVNRVVLPRDIQLVFPEEKAEKAELANHQVELIWGKLIQVLVCDYGRFHSNFTGLCREVRAFLQVDGQKLHEIDVVNSQPYFLGLLLLEVSLCGHSVPILLRKRGGERDLPYVCPLEGKERLPRDLKDFLQDTAEGIFYERFLRDSTHTRDQLKPKVFQILYGDRHVMEHSTLTDAFRSLYPTVFEMTKTLKKEKGYEWVGRELQRRESRLVINGVCDILRTDYPDVPVVTIHDSLLTTEPNLPLINQLLQDQFSRFPYPPKFRVKGNNPDPERPTPMSPSGIAGKASASPSPIEPPKPSGKPQEGPDLSPGRIPPPARGEATTDQLEPSKERSSAAPEGGVPPNPDKGRRLRRPLLSPKGTVEKLTWLEDLQNRSQWWRNPASNAECPARDGPLALQEPAPTGLDPQAQPVGFDLPARDEAIKDLLDHDQMVEWFERDRQLEPMRRPAGAPGRI
jgi:hypothetical protein